MVAANLRSVLTLALGPLASVALVAGCGFVPSEPDVPPVGVRQDAGILSIIVPHCSGAVVRSVNVIKFLTDREPDPSWSATGFTGDLSQGIVLGPQNWSLVRGSYRGLTSFSIEVSTDKHHYGTAVDPPFLDRTKSLPKDSFLVEDTVMTLAEYAASVSRFPC
jgi:hypothetical protein